MKQYIETMTKANDLQDLHSLRKDIQRLKSPNPYATYTMGDGDNMYVSHVDDSNFLATGDPASTIQRLETERQQLMLQGYDTKDPLVQQIDETIAHMQRN